MPLPASGQITSEQIRAQYGGSTPFRIQDYYRGGARVPNTAPNQNIPTSGPISFSNFYGQGGSGGGLSLSGNPAPYGSRLGPGTSTVTASPNLVASGGSGSYSFNTIKNSGATMALNNPNLPTVSVSQGMTGNSTISATYTSTVTDTSNGQTASFQWTATLESAS